MDEVDGVGDLADVAQRLPRQRPADPGVSARDGHQCAHDEAVDEHAPREEELGPRVAVADLPPQPHLQREQCIRGHLHAGAAQPPHESGCPLPHHPQHRERRADEELPGANLGRVVGAGHAFALGVDPWQARPEGAVGLVPSPEQEPGAGQRGEHGEQPPRRRRRAPAGEEREHDEGEHQVHLLFERQAPQVLHRVRQPEQPAVVLAGDEQVGVLPVRESAEPFPEAEAPTRAGERRPDHDDAEQHHERGGKQPAGAALVEPPQRDRAAALPLGDHQPRDQEAREGEEHRDRQHAARQPRDVVVVEQHDRDAEPTDAVERGQVIDTSTGRLRLGARQGFGGAHGVLSHSSGRPPACRGVVLASTRPYGSFARRS